MQGNFYQFLLEQQRQLQRQLQRRRQDHLERAAQDTCDFIRHHINENT